MKDNCSRLDKRDKFEDLISWYTGSKLSKLTFIAQGEQVEQPSDYCTDTTLGSSRVTPGHELNLFSVTVTSSKMP